MNNQQGFSLVEVLVALIIVIIMAVGASKYQVFAIQRTSDSHYRTHALWLAKNALDRLEANPSLLNTVAAAQQTISINQANCANSGNVGNACHQITPGNPAFCTEDNWVGAEIAELRCMSQRQLNGAYLPNGQIVLTCSEVAVGASSFNCSASVLWDLPMTQVGANANANANERGRLDLQAVINQ